MKYFIAYYMIGVVYLLGIFVFYRRWEDVTLPELLLTLPIASLFWPGILIHNALAAHD